MDGKARRASYNQANCQPNVIIECRSSRLKSDKKERCYILNGQSIRHAEDGCDLLEKDLSDETVQLFETFIKVLNWIGVRFDPNFGSHLTLLRFLWLLLIMAFGIWSGGYDIYCMLFYSMPRTIPGTLVYLALVFQAIAAMEKRKHIQQHSRCFWILQTYILLSCLLYTVVMAIDPEGTFAIVHPKYIYTFYYPELRFTRPLFSSIFFTILLISLHTYLALTNALFWEAKKFNYLIDHIFAFTLTASIIPTTLFVLSFVLSRISVVELLLSSPAVSFCVYEYYAIMYPAKLHEELCKSKAALCMNHNVWVPYEKSVNKIAHTLVMHLDQTDLGISLWGFALVTKPLVLTVSGLDVRD
ncbi:unnamed protein product, partial [Mesorhabditis belari]|uniref:Uncharacterized protein n=1 Tax=Mesorhabditis belari TaxID=2138241 RepID=A0AAF3EUM8_9BILA